MRVNFIPPLDLKEQYQSIQTDIQDAVVSVLASGRYIKGPPVEQFEEEFARYIGVPECIACNSGTDALYLALRALNIGPGDEVITTSFTFIATAEVITAIGATPVFVDIEASTFNMSPQAIAAAITERTRAIMPVHLFGCPANMDQIMAIAQAHQLAVVEDCAQAVGATWNHQRVGSIGHIGCFSFYPTKNLGACGDGGAVTTRDPAIAAKIRMLGDHGRTGGTYYHEAVGVNSRLDAIQAAILSIKLRHLDGWNLKRQQIAQRYTDLIEGFPYVSTPSAVAGGQSVWNQYTLRVSHSSDRVHQDGLNSRDSVRSYLQNNQVGSAVYYPLPLHLQPVYTALGYKQGALPEAERAANEVLSLPMYPELSIDNQESVVYTLKDALATLSKEAQ